MKRSLAVVALVVLWCAHFAIPVASGANQGKAKSEASSLKADAAKANSAAVRGHLEKALENVDWIVLHNDSGDLNKGICKTGSGVSAKLGAIDSELKSGREKAKVSGSVPSSSEIEKVREEFFRAQQECNSKNTSPNSPNLRPGKIFDVAHSGLKAIYKLAR